MHAVPLDEGKTLHRVFLPGNAVTFDDIQGLGGQILRIIPHPLLGVGMLHRHVVGLFAAMLADLAADTEGGVVEDANGFGGQLFPDPFGLGRALFRGKQQAAGRDPF